MAVPPTQPRPQLQTSSRPSRWQTGKKSAAFKEGHMTQVINQQSLLGELDTATRKINNKNLKNPYRTKKHVLKMLSKPQFKTPYVYKWCKDMRDSELLAITKGGTFTCPCCEKENAKAVLQHDWHPTPYRVLATRAVDDDKFCSMIPEYIVHQTNEKGAFTLKEYKKTIWYIKKQNPRYTEKEVYEYAYAKTKSNYALGYFTDNELLLHHIDEIKRHIRMEKNDYDFVCRTCAHKQDKYIIDSGRLYPDEPYFLYDEDCDRRELLASACIEAWLSA
jgi:hypothetical protein